MLTPTNNAYLWSIDAKTGLPDLSFGSEGTVDLTEGLGRKVDRKTYSVISAPIVINDILVVGASIRDGPRNKEAPQAMLEASILKQVNRSGFSIPFPKTANLEQIHGRTIPGNIRVILMSGQV